MDYSLAESWPPTTLVQVDRADNGFEVLRIDSDYAEIGRVYGAARHKNAWVMPAEFPFLIKVYEDLQKLKLYKNNIIGFDKETKQIIETKIQQYLNKEKYVIPKYGMTTLRDHQLVACANTFNNPRFGLYMDCRTGKTLVMLCTIQYHSLKAFVVCPRIACENWVQEVQTHMPNLKAISIYGKDKKTRASLLDKAIQGNYDIIITSFENLRIIKDEISEKLDFNCLIVDEAHRIKSYNSRRTKAIVQIAGKAKHRYLLTGTPTLGSPTDIFTQMLILSPAILCGWNYWKFTQKFLTYSRPRVSQDSFGNKFVDGRRFPVGVKNLDVLNQMIAPYIMRVRRSECKGLPEREDIFLDYSLSKEQKDIYKQIIEDDSFIIGDKEYFIANGAVKFFKLSMICSGFLYYYEPDCPVDKKGKPLKEHRKVLIFKKNPKLELLKEYLEDYLAEPSNKVVIWSNYDQEQDFVLKEFSDYGLLELRGGGSKRRDPFEIVKQFNEDPKIRILSAKQSMGIAVDLSVASSAFCFSRSPSFDFDRQSRDRIDGYRQKSSSVTMYYFKAKNTIDDMIHKIISDKEDLDKKLTNINKKCLSCATLVECLNKNIDHGSSKCSFKKLKL